MSSEKVAQEPRERSNEKRNHEAVTIKAGCAGRHFGLVALSIRTASRCGCASSRSYSKDYGWRWSRRCLSIEDVGPKVRNFPVRVVIYGRTGPDDVTGNAISWTSATVNAWNASPVTTKSGQQHQLLRAKKTLWYYKSMRGKLLKAGQKQLDPSVSAGWHF